jgi:selenocysteine lyase/cysteine desulfurase
MFRESAKLTAGASSVTAHRAASSAEEAAFAELCARFTDLRAREYARLDREGHVYLDYTGGSLYAESQLRQHQEMLQREVLGNPHSESPTSLVSTKLVDRARASVLEYFRASPEEYAVIFTHNASTALKLVGEAYPFSGGRLLMTYDNHNSVNGIREFARAKRATIRYLPIEPPELRVDEARLDEELARAKRNTNNLFAFPAQSNFSGVQHPFEWIDAAHESGWDVIVDAAAFAPTNRLDLTIWRPDFVPLSFYKMFGYPTGLGCLIARRRALSKLRRPWFAGGTVWGVSVASDFHVLLDGAEAFEDGTVDYLGIPAMEIGLRHAAKVGIDDIHEHVMGLTARLLDRLLCLRHQNGQRLVEIYGPEDCRRRGANVALNFLDPNGRPVDERIVERTASARNISLRAGCLCNPGGFEGAWSLTRDKFKVFRPQGWQLIKAVLGAGERVPHPSLQDYIDKLGLRNGGAIRISLGIASTLGDVDEFLRYAETFLDVVPDGANLRPRLRC